MFDDYFAADSDFWQEPDFLLTDLVSGLVNKGGMELGITLFVKGLVMTGTLTAEQEYLKAISGMFASQAKKNLVNPSKNDLKATEEAFDFTGLAEDVDLTELYGERDEEFNDEGPDEEDLKDFEPEEPATPPIRYLHLKDPVIIQPQPPVSFEHTPVSILRVKLTTIDGWMIGKVSMNEDDSLANFPPPSPNEIRH